MNIPTKYKGKNYTNAINNAIQKAQTEYLYPTSSALIGMRYIIGKRVFKDLIAEEIYKTKIPVPLKIKLIGKEKYNELKMR